MLSIKDVYEKFDEIGCCSFATLDGNGGVDSRIAHFFAYDDEGLYLRTMTGKPFFRQMIEGGRLSVGCAADVVVFDPDKEIVVDASRFLSRGKNTPFDGKRYFGEIELTLVGGKTAYQA